MQVAGRCVGRGVTWLGVHHLHTPTNVGGEGLDQLLWQGWQRAELVHEIHQAGVKCDLLQLCLVGPASPHTKGQHPGTCQAVGSWQEGVVSRAGCEQEQELRHVVSDPAAPLRREMVGMYVAEGSACVAAHAPPELQLPQASQQVRLGVVSV